MIGFPRTKLWGAPRMDLGRGTQAVTPKFSAAEIRARGFKKGVFGYAGEEVDQFLDQVAKQVDRAQRTERELQEKVQALQEEVLRFRAREAEIQKTREKVQAELEVQRAQTVEECQKLLAESEAKAQAVRERTEEWLAQVLERIEETERRKSSFLTAFRSALDSHYELLRKEEEELEPLGSELSKHLRESFRAPEPRATN